MYSVTFDLIKVTPRTTKKPKQILEKVTRMSLVHIQPSSKKKLTGIQVHG